MKRRRSKNIYDKYITMDNLYSMWNIIRKTCKNKKEVYYFSLNLNTNLYNIYLDLKNKCYEPSRYRPFMIFEPKPRLVMSQTISDKIVNHFVTNYYLIPYLDPLLIDVNVATRKCRGSGYAMILVKKYFNKLLINYPGEEIYCLKIDISKYFYSIDHNILLELLEKNIADRDILDLIRVIISETNSDYVNECIRKYNVRYGIDIPYYRENTGLSIGAMCSQFLAIYYLNSIDHYIKEQLGCSYYVRYMDDFLILDRDKGRLKECYFKISEKLCDLKLVVNKKSNLYRCSRGVSFLGYNYRVINNKLYVSCKKDTYVRICKKLTLLEQVDFFKYKRVSGGYYGYLKVGTKVERENFKMDIRDVYDSYKKKYSDYLVVVKSKGGYKTYGDDGKMLFYLFGYKNNWFGYNAYDRVVNMIMKSRINFLVVSKDSVLLSFCFDDNNYLECCSLAVKKYDMFLKEMILIKKMRDILYNFPDSYSEIETFFDRFV